MARWDQATAFRVSTSRGDRSGPGRGVRLPGARRRVASWGLVRRLFRHRVEGLDTTDGTITGVHGKILENSNRGRAEPTQDAEVGEFSARASAVVLATGGVGGNPTLVRELFTDSFGTFPDEMLCGNPAYVDGKILAIAKKPAHTSSTRTGSGSIRTVSPTSTRSGRSRNPPQHRPSALWLDGSGRRFPPPLYPNFDGMSAVTHVVKSGFSYSG